MTFQAAQQNFSTILSNVNTGMTGAEITQRMRELDALQQSLPGAQEFDVLADAISDAQSKLRGAVTQATLRELKQSEAGIVEASTLLSKVATKAGNDARNLTLEKPTLIAAALSESVIKLQELKTAANTRDFEQITAKTLALTALLRQIQGSIKTV